MQKECIVLSIGGSVVLSDDLDTTFFNDFKKTIQNISEKYRVFIIVGGGKTARTYINLGRSQGFSEADLDWLGINATRMNARFLSMIFSLDDSCIPTTIEEAIRSTSDIVVMGGTTPGHSTDFVGAALAEQSQATVFIIATNVDGVYDKDPNKYPDAKKFTEIAIDTLLDEYGNQWETAGKNMVIDGPALQKIKDAGMNTIVINGKHLEEITHIINNEPFNGTKITL